ncbi:MAG: SDR family NAD(P)-dependent oxidoreductase, partial [Woeseiaceae bacterium]
MTQSGSPAVAELLNLAGQSVLVTGASGNIGRGIAARLSEAGARVIVHYRSDADAAESLAATLTDAIIVQADLTVASDVDALFATASPDLVVNNAALQPVQALGDMSIADWRLVQQSNLDSAFLVTQRAALAWQAAGTAGAIVNIASIEGLDPAAGHGHYATSKAAVLM